MSLLNEVLRDIDQRRREARDQQILTSALVAPEAVKQDWIGPSIIFVVLLSLGTLAYYVINQNTTNNVLFSTFELPLLSTPMHSETFVLPQVSVQASAPPSALQLDQPLMALPRVDSRLSTKVDTQVDASTDIILSNIQDARQIQEGVTERAPVSLQQSPTSQYMTREISQNPNVLIDQYLSNNIPLDVVEDIFSKNIYTWPTTDVHEALERISYGGRSIDDLARLLEMNRLLESVKTVDRTQSILNLYSQLRLKSVESGYWAFQQAVLLDKTKEARQAYYYYRQAIQSNHITTRQRKLSKLRVEQLRYEFRR